VQLKPSSRVGSTPPAADLRVAVGWAVEAESSPLCSTALELRVNKCAGEPLPVYWERRPSRKQGRIARSQSESARDHDRSGIALLGVGAMTCTLMCDSGHLHGCRAEILENCESIWRGEQGVTLVLASLSSYHLVAGPRGVRGTGLGDRSAGNVGVSYGPPDGASLA
jgi:hypothetical protein